MGVEAEGPPASSGNMKSIPRSEIKWHSVMTLRLKKLKQSHLKLFGANSGFKGQELCESDSRFLAAALKSNRISQPSPFAPLSRTPF